MAAGFDVATASIALALSSFRICIQAYQVVTAAQRIGTDGAFIESLFQWEQDRLVKWGQLAGLVEGAQPVDRLNWTMISNQLAQMEALLTSADKLRELYSLNITEENDARSVTSDEAPKSGVAKLLAKLQPTVQSAKAKIIQTNNSPVKRLGWALIGKDKLKRIAQDLSGINDRLHNTLDYTERIWQRAKDTALLRDLISRSLDPLTIQEVQELLDPDRHEDDDELAASGMFFSHGTPDSYGEPISC
jgi:hemolysin-activating ACP:hemolysin acyltransferase